MSASIASSAIFVSDSPKTIKDKINKCAPATHTLTYRTSALPATALNLPVCCIFVLVCAVHESCLRNWCLLLPYYPVVAAVQLVIERVYLASFRCVKILSCNTLNLKRNGSAYRTCRWVGGVFLSFFPSRCIIVTSDDQTLM